jgi:hypothetical protein
VQLTYAAHAFLVKGWRTVWAPVLDPQVCVGAAGRRMADQAVSREAPLVEGSAPLSKARERPSCLQLTLWHRQVLHHSCAEAACCDVQGPRHSFVTADTQRTAARGGGARSEGAVLAASGTPRLCCLYELLLSTAEHNVLMLEAAVCATCVDLYTPLTQSSASQLGTLPVWVCRALCRLVPIPMRRSWRR